MIGLAHSVEDVTTPRLRTDSAELRMYAKLLQMLATPSRTAGTRGTQMKVRKLIILVLSILTRIVVNRETEIITILP